MEKTFMENTRSNIANPLLLQQFEIITIVSVLIFSYFGRKTFKIELSVLRK